MAKCPTRRLSSGAGGRATDAQQLCGDPGICPPGKWAHAMQKARPACQFNWQCRSPLDHDQWVVVNGDVDPAEFRRPFRSTGPIGSAAAARAGVGWVRRARQHPPPPILSQLPITNAPFQGPAAHAGARGIWNAMPCSNHRGYDPMRPASHCMAILSGKARPAITQLNVLKKMA